MTNPLQDLLLQNFFIDDSHFLNIIEISVEFIEFSKKNKQEYNSFQNIVISRIIEFISKRKNNIDIFVKLLERIEPELVSKGLKQHSEDSKLFMEEITEEHFKEEDSIIKARVQEGETNLGLSVEWFEKSVEEFSWDHEEDALRVGDLYYHYFEDGIYYREQGSDYCMKIIEIL